MEKRTKIKFLRYSLRVLIGLAGVFLIILVFPRQNGFHYEYIKGSPWKHENLIAKYDFPIYKSDREYKEEKSDILKNSILYFDKDLKLSNIYIDNLEAFYLDELDKISESDTVNVVLNKKTALYKNAAKRYLDIVKNAYSQIYDIGIVRFSDDFKAKINDTLLVRILENKYSKDVYFRNLYTEKTAYSALKDLIKFQDTIYSENDFPKINFRDFLKHNVFYNTTLTKKVTNNTLSEISKVRGLVQAGELIIYKGELVSDEKFIILNSLRKFYEDSAGELKNTSAVILGQSIIVLLIFAALFLSMIFFERKIYESTSEIIFIVALPVLVVFIFAALDITERFDVYLIPVTIIPLIVVSFYSAGVAIAVHSVSILIIGFFVPNSFEYVIIQFIAGYVATFGAINFKTRVHIIKISLLVFITYCFIYIGFEFIQEGSLKNMYYYRFIWFAGSSILILMIYPLTLVFERVFGFLSDITLLELSDTNRPLLRMLAEKAPGSFHHSIQVANLAEEAVRKIDGNSLLVRAGALYHDIGKSVSPIYFTENKMTEQSPHEFISPEKSAEIIINHTIEGVEIARKNKIPEQIIDFIRTHHGCSTVRWFLHAYKQQNPGIEPDMKKFTYPGMLPRSKETAVLAMADSVEAASRSLKIVNEQTVSELVEKIVNYQIAEHYFENADITFAQITKVKEVFKQKLKNIYHSRISYPE